MLDWTWITGNHDAGLIDHCGGTIRAEAKVDGLVLRHEADPAERRPELSGHFHPALRLSLRGRRVRRRCFVATATKLVLNTLTTGAMVLGGGCSDGSSTPTGAAGHGGSTGAAGGRCAV